MSSLFGHAGHPPPAPGPASPGIHSAPCVARDESVTVALTGKPLWVSDGGDLSDPQSVAEAILPAYRRHGRGLLEKLQGAFALAVLDEASQSVLLAIDRMGIERLVYAAADQWLVFGSSVTEVARSMGTMGLDQQALFDYLLLHMVPAPRTIYTGVHKLRAGTCLTFTRGAVKVERYWKPSFVEYGGDSKELREELLQALEVGVRRTAAGGKVGAFLSGGLDSSSVSGMLARVQGGSAATFSIGFGVAGYDEREYARIAARQFGLVSTEYDLSADDVVSAFMRVAAASDEPFGNSSIVPTYFCAKVAAEHGIDHLLAGDGGDELFGGNERYARQRLFEQYSRVPAFLRSGLIEPLLSGVSAERGFLPLRKLRSYVDQARIPLPERLESWNYMYRADLAQMLDPGMRAQIDPRSPLLSMQELYDSAPCETLLNKMLFFDWQYTLADNDLRKVATGCELAGIAVSYPMLDPRVIDLSLRVPSAVKMRGYELRSFYKDATRSFLPREILEKKKHGFGLPFGQWLKTHTGLADLIYGLLSALKARRIIQPAFLDDLIAQHRSGHPSYFGYAIWDLAMLEAWFATHPQPSASAAAG